MARKLSGQELEHKPSLREEDCANTVVFLGRVMERREGKTVVFSYRGLCGSADTQRAVSTNANSASICWAQDCKLSCPWGLGRSQKWGKQVGRAMGSGGDCGQLECVCYKWRGHHTQVHQLLPCQDARQGVWVFLFFIRSCMSKCYEILQCWNTCDKCKTFSTQLSEPWRSQPYNEETVYTIGSLGHRSVLFSLVSVSEKDLTLVLRSSTQWQEWELPFLVPFW